MFVPHYVYINVDFISDSSKFIFRRMSYKQIGPYRYQLDAELGRGNFSVVFKGIHVEKGTTTLDLEREVAIKVIDLEYIQHLHIEAMLESEIGIIQTLKH